MRKLIFEFIKAKGRKPNAIEMLELKARFRDQNKIIQFPKDRITNWLELRPGKKTPIKKETTLDDLLKGKSHIDERGREWTFKKRTEGDVVPIKSKRSEFLKKYTKDGKPNDVELNALANEHRILSAEAKKLAETGERYGDFTNINNRRKEIEEVLDFMKKEFPGPKDFASGGIAGQLHLNRPGYGKGKSVLEGLVWLANKIAPKSTKIGQTSKTLADKTQLKKTLAEFLERRKAKKTVSKDKRQLTDDEIRDYEAELGDSETWMNDGTVGEAKKALKDQKAYERYMYNQYKAGKLDPKPGEPNRKRFLEKKLEEMEMSGDKRLMTREEIEELSSFDPGTEMDEAIKKYKQKDILGKFTKAEVLIARLQSTLKGSKDPYVKKTFPNFIKELQKNPKLANDPKVWKELIGDLPKNQRIVVHSDDSVDLWTQSDFGPHNIETTNKFMKKHGFTRDEANRILNMEPEDQILEMKRLETLADKSRTKQAAGGIAGQLHLNRPGYAHGKTAEWEFLEPKKTTPEEREKLKKRIRDFLLEQNKLKKQKLSQLQPKERPEMVGPPYETNKPREAIKEYIRRTMGMGSGVIGAPIGRDFSIGLPYGPDRKFDFGIGYGEGNISGGYGVNVEGDDTMGIQYQGDNFGVDVEKKEGSEPRLTFGFKKKLKKKPKYIFSKAEGGLAGQLHLNQGGRVPAFKGGLMKLLQALSAKSPLQRYKDYLASVKRRSQEGDFKSLAPELGAITGGGILVNRAMSRKLKDITNQERDAWYKKLEAEYREEYKDDPEMLEIRLRGLEEDRENFQNRKWWQKGPAYNDGGRVRFQGGTPAVDPRMYQSYQQNIAEQDVQREINQAVRGGTYDQFLEQNLPTSQRQFYGDLYDIGAKGHFTGTFRARQNQLVGDLARSRLMQQGQTTAPIITDPAVKAHQEIQTLIGSGQAPIGMDLSTAPESRITNEAQANRLAELMAPGSTQSYIKPTFEQRMGGESWDMLSDNDQYRIAQEYPGQTPPRRNPGFIPSSFAKGGLAKVLGV